MSRENFRVLLAAHKDVCLSEDIVDTTTDLDTNTSAFDRINLGSFYEEHKRQQELLVDSEDLNRRRSPTRKFGVRKSPRVGNLATWRYTGSVPDISVRNVDLDREQMVFISFCNLTFSTFQQLFLMYFRWCVFSVNKWLRGVPQVVQHFVFTPWGFIVRSYTRHKCI